MKKRIYYFLFLLISVLYTVQSCNYIGDAQSSDEQIPDQLSYNFDIRPIFSDKCFACHGPDANKRQAGLRLDNEKDAFKALKENPSAHAIVSGKPKLSEVFMRISSKDTSILMPPPSSNLKLTSREINLIEKWISQGAKYETHWSFTRPKKSPLPKVKDAKWAKNEIDYFTLSKMEQKTLQPNLEAKKEYLLKRLSLD